MFRSVSVAALACAISGLAPGVASASQDCNIDAHAITGTYGFSAQGLATVDTPFAPAGPFVQSGTVTHVPGPAQSTNSIRGTWSVKLGQNDAHGYTPNVTFGGTFQIDRTTCTGDFFVNSPVKLAAPAFHVVVVDRGDELRTISAIPNLIIAYTSAKHL